MKQMEYIGFKKEGNNYYREVIDEGTYKGFNYYIINLGTHPCSYIEIPKENKLYNKHYFNYTLDDEPDVHGGITYSADHLIGISENEDRWFIGWDYAHYGDYIYYRIGMENEGHKWTTEELHKEVLEVIDKLVESKGE